MTTTTTRTIRAHADEPRYSRDDMARAWVEGYSQRPLYASDGNANPPVDNPYGDVFRGRCELCEADLSESVCEDGRGFHCQLCRDDDRCPACQGEPS